MDRLSELTARMNELDRASNFLQFVRLSLKYPNPEQGTMAIREAENLYGQSSAPARMLKTAVAGGTTQTHTGLVPDPSAARAWMSILSGRELAGRVPIPRVGFNSNALTESAAGSATWTAEGAPIPVSKFSLASATLDRTKISGILVFSDETVRIDSADNLQLINTAMLKVIARYTDQALLDPETAAVAGKNPASLTNGVGATVSTGSTEAAITANLKSMLQSQVDAGADLNDVAIAMHPTTALHMSQLLTAGNIRAFPNLGVRGGEIFGVPVLTTVGAVSSGSPSERILAAINPMGCLLAAEAEIQVSASKSAAIQLLDNPTNNLDGTATNLVSLFQTGTTALRFSRYINFAAIAGAVSYMRVTY